MTIIIRHHELKPKKGVSWSRTHIARLERVGAFPKRVRLGQNSFGYIESEIDEHLSSLAAARSIG
jgi:prophage regulatory protein